jgi:hypothetical protein
MSSNHPAPSKAVALSAAQTTLGGWANRLFVLFGLLGLAGLGAGVGLGWNRDDGLQYFLHSYLWNYSFVLSIALGSLFFVLLQHASRAGWSVTVRRLAEFLAAPFGLLFVLFLPILIPTLLGKYCIYEWAIPAAAHGHDSLGQKALYLNPTFFGIRAIFYFGVWWYLGRFYLAKSIEQDRSGDVGITLRLEKCSYVSILFFAVTVTFAAIDWLMSLMPQWYSTIFGLYYYSGCMVAVMAVLILAAIVLQSTGRLTEAITVEHYHDLGKLLFTFVVFWGYIAFSQYLLIWYANIPEETQWYLLRQNGNWKWVSLALLFGQLFIPFVGLLSRHAKRQKYLLGFWAVWVLAMHWLDLYWVVMPSVTSKESPQPPFSPIDICLLVGLLGVYAASVMRAMAGRSLTPLSDPRLEEALAFENV